MSICPLFPFYFFLFFYYFIFILIFFFFFFNIKEVRTGNQPTNLITSFFSTSGCGVCGGGGGGGGGGLSTKSCLPVQSLKINCYLFS